MTTDTLGIFPFGQPLRRCSARRARPAQLFILGAYPSALHVAWTPSVYGEAKPQRIQALAVDNEPEPFWAGEYAEQYLEQWKQDVHFDAAWGTVTPAAPRFNGPSGQ